MKPILLATSLLLSSISFAGPSCIWDLESTEVKNINGSKLNIERYDCRNKDWWKGEVIADVFKASVINTKGETMTLEDSDKYEAITLLSEVPVNALYFSYPGFSNVGNSVRIFDKDWKQTLVLRNPVNQYHVDIDKLIQVGYNAIFLNELI